MTLWWVLLWNYVFVFLCCIVLFCVMLFWIVLYCVVLCCDFLWCDVLYRNEVCCVSHTELHLTSLQYFSPRYGVTSHWYHCNVWHCYYIVLLNVMSTIVSYLLELYNKDVRYCVIPYVHINRTAICYSVLYFLYFLFCIITHVPFLDRRT